MHIAECSEWIQSRFAGVGWNFVCDPGWPRAGEYCYQYHGEHKSWTGARNVCRGRNGYLVNIRDYGVQRYTEGMIELHAWIFHCYSNIFLVFLHILIFFLKNENAILYTLVHSNSGIVNGCEHVWTAGHRGSGYWFWDSQHSTRIQWSNWDKGLNNIQCIFKM